MNDPKMKKIFFQALLGLILVSCNPAESENQAKSIAEQEEIKDHKELQIMHDEDQADRMPESGEIDWSIVLPRDSTRLKRALEIVEQGELHTSKDYYHAAIIFQHGYDTIASGLAVRMMEKAIELDPSTNKWLLAAAIDRDLQRRGKPQIFGIQFAQNEDGIWGLYDIDTTQVSDAKRKEYGVASLSELRAEAAKMNK